MTVDWCPPEDARRRRCLLLDIAVRYINPTRNLVPSLVAHVGDTAFFGPGYVSSEVLARGLAAFVAEQGPFDVVFATEFVVFARVDSLANVTKSFRQSYCTLVPLADLAARERILDDIEHLSCLKIALLLESDFYNFSQARTDALDRRFDLVAGINSQFFKSIRDLPDLAREDFAATATEHWHEFVTRHQERIIPLIHFVSGAEFDFTALAHRPADWCVPGTPYNARRRARTALTKAGAHFSRGRPLPVVSVLNRLGLRPLSRWWFMTHYQESFRTEIRSARYGFTCGSALHWPIRKFLEIPALGAVLACEPCNGFEALGFRDGENAIVCPPEALPDLTRRLNRDLDAAQTIADAGRALVSRRHTLTARAAQVRHALELALAGRWLGAVWRDGEMVFLGQPMPVAHSLTPTT